MRRARERAFFCVGLLGGARATVATLRPDPFAPPAAIPRSPRVRG